MINGQGAAAGRGAAVASESPGGSGSGHRAEYSSEQQSPTIVISRFRNKHDNRPEPAAATWAELVDMLSTHETRPGKDGPLWSPTRYPAGATRANAHVQALTALVYELDGADPDWPLLAGLDFVAHSTHRHWLSIEEQDQDGNTVIKPPAPRWRLVLRLARPVPAATWRQTWQRARARYAPSSDPACKDAGRMYYLPSRPPDGPAAAVRIGAGAAVDPATLPEAPSERDELEQRQAPRGPSGDRAGDRYVAETTWADLLEPHGWRRGRDHGGREVWIRPGKAEQDARSANTTPDDNLYVWSSNAAPFEPQQSYTKLAAYVLLEHGGDWPGALRALTERYGRVPVNPIHRPQNPQNPAPAPWPELIALDEVGAPAFPLDALAPWLRAYVAALAQSLQVPVDLVGTLALAALATACAGRLLVHPWGDWREPANLYVVAVLPPGERKTAAYQAVTAPIRALEAREATELGPAIAERLAERKVKEQRLAAAQQTAAKAPPPERDAALADVRALAADLEATTVPAVPQRIADDVTPETIVRLLGEQGGRLAVLSDEADFLDILGGRYAKDGAPNLGGVLKAHAGSPLRVHRMGRAPTIVEEPALTIAITMQPDVLAGLAQRPSFRGRGLLARFLYCLPQSPVGQRQVRPAPVPQATRQQYDQQLTALLRLEAATDDAGGTPAHTLELTPPAAQLLERFMGELEPRLAEDGDLHGVGDWAGKLAGAVCRIAALLHAAEQPAAPWQRPIGEAAMAGALRLGRYFLAHARAAFAAMDADPDLTSARRLLTWILRHGRPAFSRRDLYQAVKGAGRYRTVGALDAPLHLLERHGYIRPLPAEARPGRPSDRYEVHPAAEQPRTPAEAPPLGSFGDFGEDVVDVRASNGSAPERIREVVA